MSAPEKLLNYIGGAWQPALGGGWFENCNPATGEVLHLVADSTAADVAAAAAFPAWRATPAPRRAEILCRAAEMLVRRKQELGRELTEEMGKVLKEGLADVQEGIDMTYYMAGEGRCQFGETVPSELPNKWAMSVRMRASSVRATRGASRNGLTRRRCASSTSCELCQKKRYGLIVVPRMATSVDHSSLVCGSDGRNVSCATRPQSAPTTNAVIG